MTESNIDELAVLKKAVEVIKQWHNFPSYIQRVPKDEIERTWQIYYDNAPEMKTIRETIKAGYQAKQSQEQVGEGDHIELNVLISESGLTEEEVVVRIINAMPENSFKVITQGRKAHEKAKQEQVAGVWVSQIPEMRNILRTLYKETMPIINHPDPLALLDCWRTVFEWIADESQQPKKEQ